MAFHSILSSLSSHPKLYLVLVLLPILSYASPLFYQIGFHLSVLLAFAVLFALWTVGSDAIHHRKELARIRNRSGFLQNEDDARLIAVNNGHPIRQFPLCSPARWSKIKVARKRELTPYVTRQYINHDQIQLFLNCLVGHVTQDFICSWYSYVSIEPAFISRIEQAMHNAFAEIKMRLDRIDIAQIVVVKLCPALVVHALEIRKAERLLRGERIQKKVPEGSELDHQLARYYLNGNLHPAVSASPVRNMELELAYLRSKLKHIIPLLFQKSETGSRVFTILIREILVCRIIQPIMEMLSDPDYWNQTFDSLADGIIQHEQSLGRKIGDALDKDNAMDADELDQNVSGSIKPPTFNAFIKQIKACDNLIDAFRIRGIISTELQKRSNDIAGYDGDDIVHGVKVSKVQGYINRLNVAQQRIEKRITALGARQKKGVRDNDTEDVVLNTPTLTTVLEDRDMLGYFAEYMDSVNRLHIVQCYVRGSMLLSPLGFTDINATEMAEILDMSPHISESWDIYTLAEGIQQIFKQHWAREAPFHIPEISSGTVKALQSVVDCLAVGNEAFSREVLVVRRELKAFIQALQDIYRIMDRVDFPGFIRSSFYSQMMVHIVLEGGVSSQADLTQKNLNIVRKSSGEQGLNARGAYIFKEDGGTLLDRTSSESEREIADIEPFSNHEAGIFEDNSRKSKSRLIMDVMFKGKRKQTAKQLLNSSNVHMNFDDYLPTVSVRTDNATNIEGELHALVNSDENSFVSFLRKKTSKILGDDRIGATKEENCTSDMSQHYTKGAKNDTADGGKTSPLKGLNQADYNDVSAKALDGTSSADTSLDSLNALDCSLNTTLTEPSQSEVESSRGIFAFGPFKKKSKLLEKTDNTEQNSTTTNHITGASLNNMDGSSKNHAKSEFVTTKISSPISAESSREDTSSLFSASGNIFSSPSPRKLSSDTASFYPSVGPANSSSQLRVQSDVYGNDGGAFTKSTASQRRVSSPLISVAYLDDTQPHHSEMFSSKDVLESEPDMLQILKGERTDDEEIQSWLEETNGVHVSSIPRSRNEIISAYSPEQDILPPIIVPPLRVHQLNSDLQRLRADAEDIDHQKAAIEKSPQSFKTGDTAYATQLKHLHYMRIGIEEEMRRLVTEKRALEMDELENVIIPDGTVISIGESYFSNEDGKDFVLYPVQVQRLSSQGIAFGWFVVRRYSEFLSMHQILKSKYPAIIQLYDMPGKLLNGLMKPRRQSFETRRVSLEKYLQNLVRHIEICKSVEFRKFLCHPSISKILFHREVGEHPVKRSFFKNVFHTVDEGLDAFRQKLRAQHNAPTFINHQQGSGGLYSESQQHLSVPFNSQTLPRSSITPQLIHHQQSNTNNNPMSSMIHTLFGPSTTSFATDPSSLSLPLSYQGEQVNGASLASATDAIIDVFIEIFELKEKNNWLRRQAVTIFLQQLFGGTVERRVNESLRWMVCEDNCALMLSNLLTTFWPAGVWDPQFTLRSTEDKRQSRLDAQGKLSSLLPELLGGIVGRHNAKRGALRWCGLFQNRRLNQHLLYTLMDELLVILFPEIGN
ncbi:tRNA (guanine-N(7)-)-methyltransferase (tRNA(m7G46)-methyltransferase) [Batrachochytrium dendrobatidis]|nr:tRNA (guanine-N(7)-)-methyltransferase (tRNA(m7G46)-methyltransferase) [Batrachochytrium dendrobatidis]